MYTERLIAWNMTSGEVEVHEANCGHRVRKDKRQEQVEFGQTDWTSQYAFAYDYWNNGILEEHEAEHGVGSFDVFYEMDFKPCVKLPKYAQEEIEMAQNNKAPAKAKPATNADEKKELPGKAPNEVPAPRSAKSKALPGGLCRCGCGREVGRTSTFAQGHDARFVSKLIEQIANGKLTEAAAIKETIEVSEALGGKLQKAIANAATAKDKAAAAAKAKADKAAEVARVKAAAKVKANAEAEAKATKSEASDLDLDAEDSEDELDSEDESDEDDDF